MGGTPDGMATPVTGNVVDQIPERWRELFVFALTKRVPSVLEALRTTSSPTPEDAQSAKRALVSEFTEHVDDESEPTATGRELDDLVGYFIQRFTMT